MAKMGFDFIVFGDDSRNISLTHRMGHCDSAIEGAALTTRATIDVPRADPSVCKHVADQQARVAPWRRLLDRDQHGTRRTRHVPHRDLSLVARTCYLPSSSADGARPADRRLDSGVR